MNILRFQLSDGRPTEYKPAITEPFQQDENSIRDYVNTEGTMCQSAGTNGTKASKWVTQQENSDDVNVQRG